jgi:phospholipase/carboxylesterase
MHDRNIVVSGKRIQEAKKALIMLHGRGATSHDILGLASYLDVKDFAIYAPQASNNTWYPLSFLVPPSQNEPWLSSAIELLKELVSEVNASGISSERIYFAGFSQGACLSLEFVTRHAQKWGGVAAFTGGLIGDKIYSENYQGDFGQTPVFIGSSNPDPHVPAQRVQATVDLLKVMNAKVTSIIYPNMGHTINQDEIMKANDLIFS